MKFFMAGLFFVNLLFLAMLSVKNDRPVELPRHDTGTELLRMVNERIGQQIEPSQSEQKPETTAQVDLPISDETEPEPVRREQAPEPVKTDSQKPQAPSEVTTPTECYVLSLFSTRQASQPVMEELQEMGYDVRVSTRYSSKVKYLVYLSGYANLEEARQVTRELEQKGQHDFQILSIQGRKNSISLGVYSRNPAAEIRRQEITDLGYQPEIAAVFGTPMGFQLEFFRKDGAALDSEEIKRLKDAYGNLKLEAQKCAS